MMNGSATMTSCPAQPRQRRFEHPPDLLVGHPARAQAIHGSGDDGLARADSFCRLLLARIGRDECAGAVPQLDDAFVLQLAISLRDRVGVNHELLRERPDTGQLLTRS